MEYQGYIAIVVILAAIFVVVPLIVASFLRNVEAGTIRLVSWLHGGTVIYRGPGKSKEIPLLTTGTTISSKVINVDLDITDQTADLDDSGVPRPIKVRILASAIVSVGDTDMLIRTPELGAAHARCLGRCAATLMRGHGATVVGTSLPQVVYRAIYMEMNARLQGEAMRLGTVTFLSDEEARLAAAANDGQVHRPWELWVREVMEE